ncbi:MAG TPA: hypothetical protein VFY78_12560 [Gammaproteobacteria bacterium]|nr:hypothetical protein [Gammaproteobacteria bacterium]
MKLLSGIITLLLINTLASCSTVRAEENGAGGNNEPATEQSEPNTPKTDSGSEPKPAPKPAGGTPEPGCS